ncbi:MAG: aryl-sulfate sulfotransferase [Bacteroidales bacterium]
MIKQEYYCLGSFQLRKIHLLFFFFVVQALIVEVYSEDVVLSIRAIQNIENTTIDSIEIVNKTNSSSTKFTTLSPNFGVYEVNLTLGVPQLPTNIRALHANKDIYTIRKKSYGIDVISKSECAKNLRVKICRPDGQIIRSAIIRAESGITNYPIPLTGSGVFLVNIEDESTSRTFKVILGSSGDSYFGNKQFQPRFRSGLDTYSFATGDSIQLRVRKGNLWSNLWHGVPSNKDTICLILPTADNLYAQPEIASQQTIVNPSGYCPLAAKILFTTNVPTRAEIRVFGKNGEASDVVKLFDTLSTTHSLPVLGLYANYANLVQLRLFDGSGQLLGSSAITMQTIPLSVELPSIVINTSLPSKKAGMTLVSYRAYLYDFGTRPFIFDEFGDIRWYLDYATSPILKDIMYDAGVERLRNGNFYFGDSSTNTIYEVNMFGDILNSWPIAGYDFHHQVLEKPNGNFLINVDKHGLWTIEDFMIEIDRTTKQIINVWDLRQSLQYARRVLTTQKVDWIHTNAVEYDPSDSTIIVSGRTQGVVKLNANNNVKWLMAPHRGWAIAGNGVDLRTKLLQPLDANNQPILDTMVVNGYTNHPDFEWNWCQHAIKKQPNGNFTMFDNGDQRNFTTAGPYSRAVEYTIDPVNMTVKQIWQYGKERGPAAYSRIVSDVDFLNDVNHVIVSPGAVSYGRVYGKIMEVDYVSKNVYFEATIYPPIGYPAVLVLHRTERLNLYPF